MLLTGACGSERRIVRVDGVMIVGAVLELIAIFLLELQCVASPDRVSSADEFEQQVGMAVGV